RLAANTPQLQRLAVVTRNHCRQLTVRTRHSREGSKGSDSIKVDAAIAELYFLFRGRGLATRGGFRKCRLRRVKIPKMKNAVVDIIRHGNQSAGMVTENWRTLVRETQHFCVASPHRN